MAFSPGSPEARLVAAARELADETGSSAFTVARVSERAGASFKSFYRCFRGKDDLLLALIEDDSRRGAEVLERSIRGHADPLQGFVTELFAMLSVPGAAGYAGVLAREYRRLGEHHPEELEIALAPLTSLLASLIATADPKRDAQTMFGVLMIGVHDVLLGRIDDPAELAAYLHGFSTEGMGS